MKVILKNVRLSFPTLFEPKTNPKYPDSPAAYSAVFMFDKNDENHKAIEEAIKQDSANKWKDKAVRKVNEFRPQRNKFCLRDGDTVEVKGKYPYENNMLLTARRKFDQGPVIIKDKNGEAVTSDQGLFYGGCYVHASVDIYAQEGPNAGIRCTLLAVKFSKNGERFGGGAQADDSDFDEIEVEEDEDLFE